MIQFINGYTTFLVVLYCLAARLRVNFDGICLPASFVFKKCQMEPASCSGSALSS